MAPALASVFIRVEKNLFLISKKCNPPVFVFVLKKYCCFFVFFKKETRFCSFFKENGKPRSELFLLHHAISPFSKICSNNLLYLLGHSKLRGKKYSPSLFSQCCWSVHS